MKFIQLVIYIQVDCLGVKTISYCIRLETKSCRFLPLTYGTKYDMT